MLSLEKLSRREFLALYLKRSPFSPFIGKMCSKERPLLAFSFLNFQNEVRNNNKRKRLAFPFTSRALSISRAFESKVRITQLSLVLFHLSLMMSVIVSRLTLGNEKKIITQEGSDECMEVSPSFPSKR